MIVNTIEYPQPSEFAIRARAIPNIPRGDGGYPTTLKTIIDMLKSDTPIDTPLSIPGSSSSCTLKDACIVLRATRIIIKTRSGFTPSEEAIRWRDSNDSMYLSALLSARVCFFSAMLDALRNPKTSAELLELANTVYGMGWKKRSEINRRLS